MVIVAEKNYFRFVGQSGTISAVNVMRVGPDFVTPHSINLFLAPSFSAVYHGGANGFTINLLALFSA